MADFTGLTVQDAIQAFAGMLDYVIGVDTSGKYFFKKRNDNLTPNMELADSTNIVSMDNDCSGWSRVYNKIVVSLGNFVKTTSPITLGLPEPHSISTYGTSELDISNNSLKIDDNLDLATPLSISYFNRYSLPKRQMRLKCKMIPQLELSDTVNINYTKTFWSWFWGDPSTYWGDSTKFYFKPNILPANNIISNVVGLELDLNNWQLYVSVQQL